MLATLLHTPRWLVAIVALCILGGYAHQMECKVFGCQSPLAAATGNSAAQDDDGSAPGADDSHCACPCHLVALAPGEFPVFHRALIRVAVLYPAHWIQRAPEAPCADIEHPPQLA